MSNRIGLSDLIYCIENVNESDPDNDFLKEGFKDEDFEGRDEGGNHLLDIQFFTDELKSYIEKNKATLKAVFFTRKTSKDIPRIWTQWLLIKALCKENGIVAGELASPSPRGGGIRDKIEEWKRAVNNPNIRTKARLK